MPKLKQNFKYIIARCSQGLMEDDTFEYNVKNCNLNNISVGVYCYNDYNLKNCSSLDEFIILSINVSKSTFLL